MLLSGLALSVYIYILRSKSGKIYTSSCPLVGVRLGKGSCYISACFGKRLARQGKLVQLRLLR